MAYQLIVYALIAGFVLVFWKAAQWTLASTRAARTAESLTPEDMLALKEACENLLEDLRAAADDATARVDLAVRKAEIIAAKLNDSLPMTSVLVQAEPDEQPQTETLSAAAAVQQAATAALAAASQPAAAQPEPLPADPIQRMYVLADQGLSATEIARREKRTPGEVKLILDLRTMESEERRAA